MVWVIDNLVTLVQEMTAVATTDPVSAVLLTLGAILTAFASLFFGYLALGGFLDLLTPESSTGGPPRTGH